MAQPKQVRVTRLELENPTVEKPHRRMIQIEYQAGELPPHFIYIDKEKWNEALEKQMIREDIEKRMTKASTFITI